MKKMLWLLLGWMSVTACSAWAESPSTPLETNAPAGDPVIVHAPVSTAVRGVPTHITAQVTPQDGALITSVVTRVRLEPGAPPIDFVMKGSDEGFVTDVPISLVRTVQRFWYSITVWDSLGRVASTIWQEVRILDAADAGGGAGGSGTGWWVAGGLAAVGATAAIIANNTGDDSDDPPAATTPAPTPPPPAPSSRDDEEDEEPSEPLCIITGAEQATFDESTFSTFDEQQPIVVRVCGTCPNAFVTVVGSWGAQDRKFPYNNPTCDQNIVFQLQKPPRRTINQPDQFTIRVLVNGIPIATTTWPRAQDLWGD